MVGGSLYSMSIVAVDDEPACQTPVKISALLGNFCAALAVFAISWLLIFSISARALETSSIDIVRQTAKLAEIAQEMKYVDEILTSSVLSYIYTKDRKWLDRYLEHEPKLEAIFDEAMSYGRDSDRGVIDRVYEANIQLVEMEARAIELTKQGLTIEAQNVINSAAYKSNKKNFSLALVKFFTKVSIRIKQELEIPDKVQFVDLTASEKAWLSNHPTIRIGVDAAYPPYEFVDDEGSYRGLAPEYLKLMGQRLGIEFKVVSGLTWEQVVEGIKNRNVDVAPVISTPNSVAGS